MLPERKMNQGTAQAKMAMLAMMIIERFDKGIDFFP
jgi:hypothetical protein